MIKEFPAEVFVVGVYCNKCGKKIDDYNKISSFEPVRYEYTCKNCGNSQIESVLPTYVVKGTTPNEIDIKKELKNG